MRLRALLASAAGVTSAGLAAAWLVFGAPRGVSAADIVGIRPTYGPSTVSEVPNAAAVTRRVWLPGLDEGYNPQGLAVVEGAVLVASYRSREFSADRGPCRVFRLDPRDGRETGHADVPAPCGHAGGLAAGSDGQLYVADTRTLFTTPLAGAFAGTAPHFRINPLGPGLVGALATSSRNAIWLGTYREKDAGRLYRFDKQVLAALRDGETLTVAHSVGQLTIPTYAQGAAIDREGRFWVSRSDGGWGEIDRLNPSTGAVEQRFTIAPGTEGIAADADGLIWAVSEAGARHTYDNLWAPFVVPFYPLVFALDPARLK